MSTNKLWAEFHQNSRRLFCYFKNVIFFTISCFHSLMYAQTNGNKWIKEEFTLKISIWLITKIFITIFLFLTKSGQQFLCWQIATLCCRQCAQCYFRHDLFYRAYLYYFIYGLHTCISTFILMKKEQVIKIWSWYMD